MDTLDKNARPPQKTSADRESTLILIADDDPTYRFLYREALEAAGFGVIEAEDGLGAVAAFKDHLPSLVVLDVLMPAMDGFSACAALRAAPASRTAPVLMATSLDDISSIERAYDAGATDFITKPIHWKILVQRIRYMLRADDAFRKLADSERRLAEAQSIASLGSFVWRVGSSAVDGSAELQRILGLVRDGGALPLKTVLRQIPLAERGNLLDAVRRALRDGAPLRYDLAVAENDASTRSIDIRGEIIVDAAGRTTLQGTIQDISERKRTEAALISARRAAESADAVKTALLSGMNHELRTPLNAIIGFSEIMSGETLGPMGDPRYKEYAADILTSGRHMFDMVTDVLDMAKLASNRYELKLEPEDLRQLAISAIGAVHSSPPGQGRKISLVEWPLPTPASVDARAVNQMLVNLLSNAVKFSLEDTAVDVTCHRDASGELWLSVIDRGIGMTPIEIETALQPFCQVDSRLARKYEGLGIGLSIVNMLIICHGSRLVIASTPGAGSRFSLVFPKELVLSEASISAIVARGSV